MKRVYAIEERCLGCHLCEVACKTAHSRTGDVYKAHMWETDVKPARIHVEGDNFASIAVNCRHCANPGCVAGCIAGALTKNPVSGLVEFDENKCVGCRTCMVQCPYDAIRIYTKALKCDLCTTGHAGGEPACVAACINQALVFEDSDEDDVVRVEGGRS